MLKLALLAIVAGVALAERDSGLVDNPIAGITVTYLDGSDWIATSDSQQLKIQATVPGDLITDLFKAGVIGDPLYEQNFLNSSVWDDHVWTVSRMFTVTDEVLAALTANNTDLLLVFDGIKMAADISLNGEVIGHANDQFMRYTFSLKNVPLRSGVDANELSLKFDPRVGVDGRFMACTGGWDWAPYTITTEAHNKSLARTFTKGVWKSVYLTQVVDAAITHVVPHTYYLGEHPTSALIPHHHADFRLDIRVHLHAPADTQGQLIITGVPGQSTPLIHDVHHVPLGESNTTVSIVVHSKDINLWWPVGLGSQPTYEIGVRFASTQTSDVTTTNHHRVHALRSTRSGKHAVVSTTRRRVGFRSVALVTGNDTDRTYVDEHKGGDGTDSLGMVIRINGVAIYSRGANMIPMDQLEARLDARAHRILVKSAADAGMNTLRVWGGGIFLPDAFYDACDALGVLVYHDMQFAQEGHAPTACQVQEDEFRHQIRRLSHHPSIIIWDGCNECEVILNTPTGVYATFVMTVVAQEDSSRVIWPSCPADGWLTGVNTLNALPNGSPKGLTPRHLDRKIETHGPYQHGAGFAAVNGASTLDDFPANLPINITETSTGLSLPNVFASEFGCSVASSFESMSATLSPHHWGLHGGEVPDTCTPGSFEKVCTGPNPMSQRNYPCDNIIDVYFGLDASINTTGEHVFKKQLWQCMVGQALVMKSDIETRRSTNEFGTVIWQLGENWPTGGWGSLEYGANAAGQVLGGRWKPLHYWLKSSLFTDVTAACGMGGVCYIKNDGVVARDVKVTISTLGLQNDDRSVIFEESLHLEAGPGVSEWRNIPQFNTTDNVLHIVITGHHGEELCSNVQLFAPPKTLNLPRANIAFEVSPHANHDGSIDITLTTDAPALFVTLTTLAQGRFSDNTMLLLPPSKTVQFIPFSAVDPKELMQSLRVEDVSVYMH